MEMSSERRREVIAALRKGTVPQRGLDFLAVGLRPFEPVIAGELGDVAQGGAVFKAVRGDYGCGKTFFGRWVQEFAKRKGFAVAEVQISETETPLHRLETVYRRAMEQLSTADCFLGAFRSVLDGWFYGLEEEVLAEGTLAPDDLRALADRADELLERRLADITRATPQFAAALRAYRAAQRGNDHATAEGLAGWLAGQPHVAAAVKRAAGVKGDVDHYAALSFLRGLLLILKDSGYAGLVLVLDEIETLQRVRGDVREKGLNALRQLIDDIDGGRFPNLYLLTTGTPAFFDGPRGCGGWSRSPNACTWTSRPTRGSTTPEPFNCGCRRSTTTAWWKSARGCGTCTPPPPRPRTASAASPTTGTSTASPEPSPAGSAARWASPPGCSSRSWWRTCSTGSTSSPTSTRPSTTG
jgi:hypothetical protein